jgi:hypothetical protein
MYFIRIKIYSLYNVRYISAYNTRAACNISDSHVKGNRVILAEGIRNFLDRTLK